MLEPVASGLLPGYCGKATGSLDSFDMRSYQYRSLSYNYFCKKQVSSIFFKTEILLSFPPRKVFNKLISSLVTLLIIKATENYIFS